MQSDNCHIYLAIIYLICKYEVSVHKSYTLLQAHCIVHTSILRQIEVIALL